MTIFSNPKIYSFEPSKNTFEILASKRSENSDVKLFQIAFGSRSCKKEFINYDHSDMSSFLAVDDAEENVHFAKNMKEISTEFVEVDTLGNFLEDNGIENVDLLKIDTQGFDIEVLNGADKLSTSNKIRNLLVEINFIPMYKGQGEFVDIYEYLYDHDLRNVDFYEKVRKNKYIGWSTVLFKNINISPPGKKY